MADTTALKNRIRAAIKANDNQEITGPVLQQALLDMVDELNGATETEASQRQNGDSTLQQGINTERQQRQDADNALGQRITNEISQERQRAEAAFDKLDMIDAAGSQVAPNAIDLTLRKNDGSEEDPEWRTLCHLLIPSVSTERAGLMSVAMRNLLYNLRNAGYAFGGTAVPSTNPGVPSGNCFYIVRGAGTYTHFKNADNESIIIENDGLYVLTYKAVENNYWEYNLVLDIASTNSFSNKNETNKDKIPTVGAAINKLATNGKVMLRDEIDEDYAFEAFITNTTGIIRNRTVGEDTYRLVKVYLKAGTYYLQTYYTGTQSVMWKYTDETFSTPQQEIIGHETGIIKRTVTIVADGYYAIAWQSSANNTDYANIPIILTKDKVPTNLIEDGAVTWDKLATNAKTTAEQSSTIPQDKELKAGGESISVLVQKNNVALYNEINVDSALEAYININTGVIVPKTVGSDRYRLVKVYLKAGTYYIHTTTPGTQAGCWKYTDNTFQTPETMIWGNTYKDGLVELAEGYYAIAWNSSANDTNYVVGFPVLCIKDRIDYQNIENAPELSSIVLGKVIADSDDFVTGKYLNNSGKLGDNPAWEYTPDYFIVTPGSILVIENMLNSGGGNNVAFYNKYKTFTGNTYNYVEQNDVYQRHYITVPNGARYARFSRQSSSYSLPCIYAIGNRETSERTPLITADNVWLGKYISDEGVIGNANGEYGLALVFIEHAGFYHIKANNGHPVLGRVTSSWASISESYIVLGAGQHDTINWLDAGYYYFCWSSRNSDSRKSNTFSINNEPMAFEYAFEMGGDKDHTLKSGIFNNLINANNTVVSKYIMDNTGVINGASRDYRLSKIHIKYSGLYWIRCSASSHPSMWEYDSTYQTPIRQVLGVGSVDKLVELNVGYYALCWSNSVNTLDQWLDLSNTFIYRFDDLLDVIENNITFPEQEHLNRINFSSLGNNDLTVLGSSTRANGVITLAAGNSNRAYLNGSLECAHWEMSAKFRCSNGVSFIMGKSSPMYGAWIELLIDSDVSKYIFHNNGEGGQYSHAYEGELGFTLNEGEDYTLRIFFNVTTTKILGFEIFGQFNEYFTYTFTNVTCNGYGAPFFYSKTTCVVKHSSISVQNYYDIKTAKMGVWGHSYVEGDSLGSDRDKTFTNLLANAIGATRVFNFGLGGDSWQGVYEKLSNEMGFASNIQYALVCCGANDASMSLEEAKVKINQIVAKLSENHIIPIFMTIAPTGTGNWYKQNWVDTNAWIRANFKYVDMEQVFLTVDATGEWSESNVRKNLYLGDNVHPSVQGHAEIFKRIQMDCPYLF